MKNHELKDELLLAYHNEAVVYGVSYNDKIFWIGKDDFSRQLTRSWDVVTSYTIEYLFDEDYEFIQDNIDEYTIILIEQGITLSPAKDNANVLFSVLLMVMDYGIW